MKVKAIVLGCLVVSAGWGAPFLRIGSGPLNASVENERDAAIDRAVAWLVASQSPEGYWGDSNVVATAVAALAVRGDREEMPKFDAEAVDKAVKWLKSPACMNSMTAVRAKLEARAKAMEKSFDESLSETNKEAMSTMTTLLTVMLGVDRADSWRELSLVVLDAHESVVTNGAVHRAMIVQHRDDAVFDDYRSAELARLLFRVITGQLTQPLQRAKACDPALAFIANTFVKTPPPAELKPLVENLARTWNEGSPAVWLSNPEAGWWLARAINGATGGDLSLPPDADGRVRNVNWRGIMAGKWINSQRIDREGNGHWDNDPEKTAFAVLLLNEM